LTGKPFVEALRIAASVKSFMASLPLTGKPFVEAAREMAEERWGIGRFP